MKRNEILKRYSLEKLDDITVFITGSAFNFCYNKADAVVKDEYKGQYRYFGGLQCDYPEGSQEYINLEKWLCELAERTLNITPRTGQIGKIYMKIDEIIKMPKVVNNVHESIYRASHISMKLIEMVNRGDSKETINEVYELMVLADDPINKQPETGR